MFTAAVPRLQPLSLLAAFPALLGGGLAWAQLESAQPETPQAAPMAPVAPLLPPPGSTAVPLRPDPTRLGGAAAAPKRFDQSLDELVRHIREVLGEAIAAGGSTLQDFAHTDGASGAFQQRFLVYDREGEPCTGCGAPIERLVQSGRSTFYCRKCQS